MRNSIFLSLFLLFGMAGIMSGQEAQSLKQAEALSAEKGKPVLLEFVRTD